ncbi:pyridoxamine 5'-phosphate oxidase family protein [Nocardioides endophyticus]|uniref:Pyridoxamine 5'-phosphate oxidase family protein n=2 Tax=Nocardioides endophyticus TaxID=1353775 RepID=A0ABP8YYK5_9ACTN
MTTTSHPTGQFERSERTKLRRFPDRANYDRDEVYAVLDEALVCHMGYQVEDQPYVIPTLCVRVGDALYLHGSAASRSLRNMNAAPRVCVTATIIDGLVLARTAFNHSINYRSVVVFGEAESVTDPDEKLLALKQFTDAVVDERWSEVRAPTTQELKATEILKVELLEAVMKVRNAPPADEPEHFEDDTWAGVVPVGLTFYPPVPDPALPDHIQPSATLTEFIERERPHPFAGMRKR